MAGPRSGSSGSSVKMHCLNTWMQCPVRAGSSHLQPRRIGGSLAAPYYVGYAQKADFSKSAKVGSSEAAFSRG